jgi:hypothetical protein
MVNDAVRTLNPAEASWHGSRIFASLVRDDEGSGVDKFRGENARALLLRDAACAARAHTALHHSGVTRPNPQ